MLIFRTSVRHLLLSIGCFLTALQLFTCFAYASEAPASNQWTIPFLGIMEGPQGFSAVNLETWMKETTASMRSQKQDAKSPANLPNTPVNYLNQSLLPKNLNLYQLQLNDGKVYHLAWSIVIKDTQNIYPDYAKYFYQFTNDDQTKDLKDLNKKINGFIALAQTEAKKAGNMNIEVLDLKPLSLMPNTKETVYSISGRIIMEANGLMCPFYAKTYFFERSGKSVVILLLASDAEGKFWNETGDSLIQSLQRGVQLLP